MFSEPFTPNASEASSSFQPIQPQFEASSTLNKPIFGMNLNSHEISSHGDTSVDTLTNDRFAPLGDAESRNVDRHDSQKDYELRMLEKLEIITNQMDILTQTVAIIEQRLTNTEDKLNQMMGHSNDN